MIQHWKRTLLLFATPILMASCDDGPTQAEQSPGVNNGANGPFVDSVPLQQLGSTTGGSNASQICTPEKRRKVWEAVMQQPIVPFRGAGGLDASATLAFTGITIDQLESGTPPYSQTAAAPGLSPFSTLPRFSIRPVKALARRQAHPISTNCLRAGA